MFKTDGFRLTIFTLVTGLLTFFIGAQIAKFSLDSRYVLNAEFDDATGLRQGDNVRVAGVPVGTVGAVKAQDGKAWIEISVSDSVELPDDTEIAITWVNLIGQRQIDLFPGTSTNMIEPGGTIRRTRSVIDIGSLIDKLGPFAATLDPAQLNTLVQTLVEAITGNESNIAQLLVDLDTVAGAIASRDDTLGDLLEDYASLTATVAERDDQIQRTVENLLLLADAFANSDDVLEDAIGNLGALSSGLDRLLTNSGDDIDVILQNLAVVTGAVVDRIDDVERTAIAGTEALASLFEATGRGHFLNVNATCLNPTPAPPCVVQDYAGLFVPSPAATSIASTLRWWLVGSAAS